MSERAPAYVADSKTEIEPHSPAPKLAKWLALARDGLAAKSIVVSSLHGMSPLATNHAVPDAGAL